MESGDSTNTMDVVVVEVDSVGTVVDSPGIGGDSWAPAIAPDVVGVCAVSAVALVAKKAATTAMTTNSPTMRATNRGESE